MGKGFLGLGKEDKTETVDKAALLAKIEEIRETDNKTAVLPIKNLVMAKLKQDKIRNDQTLFLHYESGFADGWRMACDKLKEEVE